MEDQHTVLLGMPQLPDHSFIAVYDGHGGEQTAQIASEQLLGFLQRQPDYVRYVEQVHAQGTPRSTGTTPPPPTMLGEAMRTAFLELDRELPRLLAEKSVHSRSGSTACAVIITPRHLVCANIGDSRAVMSRVDEQVLESAKLMRRHASDVPAAELVLSGLAILPMSEDHKPSNPVETQRIEAAGGTVVLDRVDGSLAVSRALGDFELKDSASTVAAQCAQKVSPEAEIRVVERDTASDQLLIVACDGIWDVLSNDRACKTALGLMVRDGEEDMGLVCEELLDSCLDLDSRDNMSAVIVAFPAATVRADGPGIAPLVAKRAARQQTEDAERETQAKSAENDTPEDGREETRDCEDDLHNTITHFSAQMGVKTGAAARPHKAALEGPLPPPSSDAQLLELRNVFDSIDTDGNGTLDKSEVSSALLRMERARFGSDLDDAFAAMDADGDGSVTFDEFQQWWEAGGKLSAIESLDLKWKQFGSTFDTMATGLLAGAFGGSVSVAKSSTT